MVAYQALHWENVMDVFHLKWFLFLKQQFLMSNKLETAMWLSRLFTVYCSVMFILPILG